MPPLYSPLRAKSSNRRCRCWPWGEGVPQGYDDGNCDLPRGCRMRARQGDGGWWRGQMLRLGQRLGESSLRPQLRRRLPRSRLVRHGHGGALLGSHHLQRL